MGMGPTYECRDCLCAWSEGFKFVEENEND